MCDYVLREAHFLTLYGPFPRPIMCTGHHYLLHYHSSIVCLHVVMTLTTQNIQFKHVPHFPQGIFHVVATPIL